MPKVSVILPVYNAQDFLRESIRSILAQDYVDFELIVLDDGSTDDSPVIIKSFSDTRIKYVSSGKIGLTKLLNLGISLATGEYLARMDADDLSLPSRFSCQVRCLDNNPRVGAVGCWWHVINDRGDVVLSRTPPNSPLRIKRELWGGNPIPHPAAMFRKKALEEVGGYDESYEWAQDRDLFLRLASKWEIGIVPEFLFCLRINPKSVTLTREREQKGYALRAMRRAIRSGSYPAWLLIPLTVKEILFRLPEPMQAFKRTILRLIGLRHD